LGANDAPNVVSAELAGAAHDVGGQ
jgi:hypothetical protein